MMNIIETMKTVLSESKIMDEFNGIHVDYTEPEEGSAGLFTSGAVKTGEDVIGNPSYRLNLTLYTGMRGALDYDRIKNSDFFLRLTYFLDELTGIETIETINDENYTAEINKVACSNQLLYSVPTGDINDGVIYQFQIAVEYSILIEE